MVYWNWKFNISKVAWKVILIQHQFIWNVTFLPLKWQHKKRSNNRPSHFPASEVPQDSHRPNSRGSPRNGFASWLAWLIVESLMDAVLYQQKTANFTIYWSNPLKYQNGHNNVAKPSNKYWNQKLLLRITIKTKTLTG